MRGKRYIRALKRLREYIKEGDIKGFRDDPLHYNYWFKFNKIKPEELEAQKEEYKSFEYQPVISILVPTYKTPEKMFMEMIDSLQSQSYPKWELCIAEASVGDDTLIKLIEKLQESDDRIKAVKLLENKGISENTNEALDLATGEFVGLLDHDDTLEPDALFEVVKALQSDKDEIDIVYTDEDKADEKLKRFVDPNFKPDFSIDLLHSHNYITHFLVIRRSIMEKIGGFRKKFDGAQDYDLLLRSVEEARKIVHVPKTLYHWRMIKTSTAKNPASKTYAYEAGRLALEEHLQRIGAPAKVVNTDLWGLYRPIYEIKGQPLISIIIANKDHTEDLDKCIRSVENKSSYRNFEIIVVENNSTEDETFTYYDAIQKEYDNVRVVYWEEKHFNYSAINNFGVRASKGEYILLLNNDTEMITETCLSEMMGICQRSDVGIVGAKLLYPDNTIQHAGVVIGFGGYAGHVFHMLPRTHFGFMMRTQINCNYSAVTAACLMTKRSVFDQVNGLTESFEVAGNDVDYCLKVRKAGYQVVYNAFSEWYHYESKSRGYEDTPEKKARFDKEVKHFQEFWGDILEEGDPFYNKNFPVTIAPFTLDRSDCK